MRPNKKISLFPVTGVNILGGVGTHIFFNYFFFWTNIVLCILKAFCLSNCIKLYLFPEKNMGFTSKLGRVTPNTVFY